jgi:hypothetical protein
MLESSTIDDYNFKNVREFSYLGAFINDTNKLEEEITKRIMSGNQAYFSHIQFKSNILSKRTKIKLYRTLVCPIITYGAETWTLKIRDGLSVHVFKRKIIWRIYAPICVEGNWRISCLGHVERMNNNRMPKILLNAKMEGGRRRGHPRKRWLDDVERDVNSLGIRNWRLRARNKLE